MKGIEKQVCFDFSSFYSFRTVKRVGIVPVPNLHFTSEITKPRGVP